MSSIGSLKRTKDKHGTERKTRTFLVAVFVTIILISLILPSFLNLVSVSSAAFSIQPINLIDVTVESGGTGYTTPAIILVGGGGTGAAATARVCNGVIYGIVLTNPGSDYTSAPTVIIIDPNPRAKGAAATVNYAQYVPAYKVFGLNFSPYTKEGQNPDSGTIVSEAQITELLNTVKPYTEWVRSFGCTNGLEVVGRLSHELGLQAAIGAWIGRDLAANEREILSLINIGTTGQADMLIVGSEVLLRGDQSETQLIEYINRVKAAVPGIPVATADVYGELLAHPAVVAAGDVVLPNYYPYWEGVDVAYAVATLNVHHNQILTIAGGKPVIVSESGWPSSGNQIGDAVPSPENAAYYFLNFESWAKAENVQSFYFEAFDEPWKAANEGPQGAHWGVWDKDGVLKAGMRDVFDGETIADNWSGNEVVGGPGTPTVEFTYVPPYGSFDNLRGQVLHVKPIEYKIVVYIKVGSGWWIKPYSLSPLTSINPDGSWVCDVTTGGIDQTATEFVAYLIPDGYAPPIVGGANILPAELEQNAVAKCQITRTP